MLTFKYYNSTDFLLYFHMSSYINAFFETLKFDSDGTSCGKGFPDEYFVTTLWHGLVTLIVITIFKVNGCLCVQ